MKSLSVRFRTVSRLEAFINKSFMSDEYIVLQLFSPKNKKSSIKQIIDLVDKLLPNSFVIGSSSSKTLLNGVLNEEIVLNFLLFEKKDFSISYFENYHDASKFIDEDLTFLYATNTNKQNFLDNLPSNCDVIGSFCNDFIIINKEIKESGFVMLKFKNSFDFSIKIADYIEPVGRELKITQSFDFEIEKIEEFSIKEFYTHYLTKEFSYDLKNASKIFPLLIKDNKKYRASLIHTYKNNKAIIDYPIKDGDTVRLGFSNTSKFYEIYQNILESYDKKQSDFFFFISSVSREKLFEKNGFDFDSAIGIFSNSELAVIDGNIYNANLAIITININQNSTNTLRLKNYKKSTLIKENLEVDALSNIAKVSSCELQVLNDDLQRQVALEVEKNMKKDSILIHRSRLAQMGEMISLIAHQWKQPLSAISATSSGLQIKAELDRYDKKFFINSLSKIEDFVNHLSTTIDDFSNFFKPSKLKKEFYIKEAIEKTLNIATYSLTKNNVHINLHLDKSIKVKTYQNELIQVLLNLIKNAENILLKRKIKNPKILIKVFKKDDKKIIQIIDNAGGVEKDIIDKIFEPYFSTKATKDSTGLGLYMSKFIVENSLNGKLEVKNENNGAIFSIIF